MDARGSVEHASQQLARGRAAQALLDGIREGERM
jgi:hypothetical protein